MDPTAGAGCAPRCPHPPSHQESDLYRDLKVLDVHAHVSHPMHGMGRHSCSCRR